MYQIIYTKKAIKEFKAVDADIQKLIKIKLNHLAQDPYQSNNNLKRLRTVKNGFRLRVDRFRVLFFIITEDKQLIITKIFIKKSDKDYNRGINNLITTQKFFSKR